MWSPEVAHLPRPILTVLVATGVALTVGTVIRVARWRLGRFADPRQRLRSLASWWALAALLAAALLMGPPGVLALFAAASMLALWELLRLVPLEPADRALAPWLLLTVPLQYLWVATGRLTPFTVSLPLGLPALLLVHRVLRGRPERLAASFGGALLAVLLAVYALSHGAFLAFLPAAWNPRAGPLGWVVLLVLLTEVNDMAQAGWGRWLGRRPLAPRVSPAKTWEGLAGGVATTTAVAVLAGPFLTPWWQGAAGLPGWLLLGGLGMVLALAGTAGDLTMSALKRDHGVSDSSSLIPGQGGALDRLDSLVFTSPLLFHLLLLLHGGPS